MLIGLNCNDMIEIEHGIEEWLVKILLRDF